MSNSYPKNPIKVPRFEEANGFYTTEQRSRIMSKIKGKNTKPEILFRKELWRRGVRYRKDYKGLPGKPDLVNKRLKLVVFIDGEFWHGYKWEEKKQRINSNRAFWIPKIERNMQRDNENNLALEAKGYTVFRFWESDVKNNLQACINKVLDYCKELK